MLCKLLVVCVFGLTTAVDWTKVFQGLSHGQHDRGHSCNDEDKRDHAIDLLEEWAKHGHMDSIVKFYTDIYHHDIPPQRKRDTSHHYVYQSNFDEAFNHGNKVPDYYHVESYVKYGMNYGCRVQIMHWIEELAHKEAPVTSTTRHHVQHTHAPHTQAPHTHAPTAKPTHKPTTTTTAKPTTVHQTSAPVVVKTHCEAVTFVTALARGTILSNTNAGLCTDGTNSQPEALVLESCNAPKVSMWKQGAQVLHDCKAIPDYTPVGMFSFGTYVQDGTAVAGIITECTADGFKIAIQLCGHPVNVYDLHSGAKDPKQNADNYYVINW